MKNEKVPGLMGSEILFDLKTNFIVSNLFVSQIPFSFKFIFEREWNLLFITHDHFNSYFASRFYQSF
jgi:hypothetical protein